MFEYVMIYQGQNGIGYSSPFTQNTKKKLFKFQKSYLIENNIFPITPPIGTSNNIINIGKKTFVCYTSYK